MKPPDGGLSRDLSKKPGAAGRDILFIIEMPWRCGYAPVKEYGVLRFRRENKDEEKEGSDMNNGENPRTERERMLQKRKESSMRHSDGLMNEKRVLPGADASFDGTDLRILELLLEDSTRTHKEIGEEVHMTGQAVGARVRRMRESGVIEGYTLRWNPAKVGLALEAYVTVFLDAGTIHAAFLAFAQADGRVVRIDRTNGEGCYFLLTRTRTMDELNGFLQEMLKYGNYKVNLSMGRLKG